MKRNNSIWTVITAYKLNSIFLRYFALIFIITVIPLTAISLSIYFYNSANAEKELSEAYERSLFKIRDTLDMIFTDVDRLSLRLSTDNEVKKFLSSGKPELMNYETIDLINTVRYKIYVPTNEYIDSIYLYTKSYDYVVSSTGAYASLPDFTDNGWYKDYTDKFTGTRNWIQYRRTKADAFTGIFKDYISLFQTAPFYGAEDNGVMVFNIDVDEFDQFFGDSKTKTIEDIYIINENNTVLFNKNTAYIGKALSDIPYLKDADPGKNVSAMINDNGNRKLISYADSKYRRKFTYISVVSFEKDAKLADIRKILVYYVLAGITLSVVLAFIISIKVYKPFGDIISIINNPEQLGRSMFLSGKKGFNELKYISSKILDFNLNRKSMEMNLTEYLTMLKKAQSIALQSQINPHFLFNTLGTINYMAMGLTNSENEVSRMTTYLSELMRLSIETQDNLISIRNEVEHAMKYIEIEKIRFADMFEVSWKLEDGIKDFMIIKITLQPILENAIYHGIKQKNGKGYILVKGITTVDKIILEIEDNGVGMEYSEVDLINSELKGDYIKEDHNIGLRNVNQRIKLIFGEEYGVKLFSERNNGTRVKIELPKVK